MPMRIRVSRGMLATRVRRFAAAGVTACLAATSPAAAQSIDYGALQQLFGEPVTTSVTGSPQRVSDAPATMEIITADDIRRSGARDIPGVLRDLADIDILQWTNDQADVSLRGYDQIYSPRVLVLVDGRQVYADWFGFTPWSLVPIELSDIRQIEIVKGPQSALFGFNAAGGVINIVTHNPLYDDVNTASAIGGTQSLAEGNFTTTQKLGDFGALRLSGGGRVDDDFSTPIPPAMTGTPRIGHDRGAVDLDAMLRLNDHTQLRLEASHSQADQNEVTPTFVFGFGRYGAESIMARLSSDTKLGLVQATAYGNWMRQLASTTLAIGNVDFANQVTVAQLQDIVKIGPDHILRGTLEYRHNTVNTTPFSGGDVFYDVYSAGGMWSWAITPELSLTNAVRLDNLVLGRAGLLPLGFPLNNAAWNRVLSEPSFNSGLVWKTDEFDTFRLVAGRGVQLPPLNNLGAFLVTRPFVLLTGVPTLDPVTVTSYELGWDRLLPPLGARLRVSAFHEDNSGFLSFFGGTLPAPGIPYQTPANVADSSANGLEIGIKGSLPKHWRWDLNYRAEMVTDHFFPGLTNLSTLVDFQHTTPTHLVNAHLGWSRGCWEIDSYLRYQSRTFGFLPTGPQSFALTPIDDYVSFDGRIGYRLTDRVTLALSGQNILFSPQRQTSGPDVERRILGWLSVKF